jgi:antitoxin (DNA-binding transcriptional repressor) of toxin-antitoxin stability system
MTKRLTEAEVQANLPELLESLKENYDEIIVTRNNIAVARITPPEQDTNTEILLEKASREPGREKGRFTIPDDAFDPMTEEELAEWGY